MSFLDKSKIKISSARLNVNLASLKIIESKRKDDELYSLIDFGKLWITHFIQFVLEQRKVNKVEHEEIAVIEVQDF